MSWTCFPCSENGSIASQVPLAYVFILIKLYGRTIQLLIALVSYKTRLQKPRQGVGSAWIASLTPSTRIPLRLISGSMLLPAQPTVPILAIGPGTGIAPIRSIVQERIATDPSAIDNTLVLGCRYSHRDFLLKAEWEMLADKSTSAGDDAEIDEQLASAVQSLAMRKPLIKLFVAASRDQSEKVYVQDVLRSQAALVWNILGTQRGIAYLSG